MSWECALVIPSWLHTMFHKRPKRAQTISIPLCVHSGSVGQRQLISRLASKCQWWKFNVNKTIRFMDFSYSFFRIRFSRCFRWGKFERCLFVGSFLASLSPPSSAAAPVHYLLLYPRKSIFIRYFSILCSLSWSHRGRCLCERHSPFNLVLFLFLSHSVASCLRSSPFFRHSASCMASIFPETTRPSLSAPFFDRYLWLKYLE